MKTSLFRTQIYSLGIIKEIIDPSKVFIIEMKNGYRAHAILSKELCLKKYKVLIDFKVEVKFSPFNMNQCTIVKIIE